MVKNTNFIIFKYENYILQGIMQCDTCGSMLESVDDTQIIDGGRFYKSKIFCERHKPLQEIYS